MSERVGYVGRVANAKLNARIPHQAAEEVRREREHQGVGIPPRQLTNPRAEDIGNLRSANGDRLIQARFGPSQTHGHRGMHSTHTRIGGHDNVAHTDASQLTDAEIAVKGD